MIFSHVLYQLSYLGPGESNCSYCKELGAPSVDDGTHQDTVDTSFLANHLKTFPRGRVPDPRPRTALTRATTHASPATAEISIPR